MNPIWDGCYIIGLITILFNFFFVFFNIGHVKKKYGSPFSGYNFTEKVNKMGAC